MPIVPVIPRRIFFFYFVPLSLVPLRMRKNIGPPILNFIFCFGKCVQWPCLQRLCMKRGWGFRSGVLSHVTKRNLKTKLQIYTEPQPCFIHFV